MKREDSLTQPMAPEAAAFGRFPESWYFVCASRALRRRHVVKAQVCGESIVLFRGEAGRIAAIASRCPHLGSDLAGGRVHGERLECPYHHFAFDGEGRCAEQGLRAKSYAVEERYGAIFVFLGREPFALPRFPGEPDLASARPMHWRLGTQWFMVIANGFDVRHFAHAHDRHVVSEPQLTRPHPRAMRVDYRYRIAGARLMNRLTRALSGDVVDFSLESWAGNFALVRARFSSDESLGVVAVEPDLQCRASLVTLIVNMPRSGHSPWSRARDRLFLALKRFAIRRMMLDDFRALAALDYRPGGLRPGDEVIAQYLSWLAATGGEPRCERSA